MIAWLETLTASPSLGILATIAFVWFVGFLTGVMISGRSRRGSTAEPNDAKTFINPQVESLERHYKEWQAHQLLEGHRNARR